MSLSISHLILWKSLLRDTEFITAAVSRLLQRSCWFIYFILDNHQTIENELIGNSVSSSASNMYTSLYFNGHLNVKYWLMHDDVKVIVLVFQSKKLLEWWNNILRWASSSGTWQNMSRARICVCVCVKCLLVSACVFWTILSPAIHTHSLSLSLSL